MWLYSKCFQMSFSIIFENQNTCLKRFTVFFSVQKFLITKYFWHIWTDNHSLDSNVNVMVFYPRYGLIPSIIPQNWVAIPSLPLGHRKILQFNSSKCWTVLIHTSDKIPSHSLITPTLLKTNVTNWQVISRDLPSVDNSMLCSSIWM